MEQKTINNVLQVMTPDKTKIVAMTSFDGGSTSEEFMDNYDYSLKKLITTAELDLLKAEKESYLPHAVFYKNKTPEAWQQFVEQDLQHFKDGMTDRTLIIVRCFEQASVDEESEEMAYVPVHVDIPDIVKLPQVFNYDKMYEDEVVA